ncbi:MAG: Gfo/Idh/MocA family oxidoreductase [Pirellulaceae bacterium]|jgi:predicted dehydrogenase|nr:Gfo/Idh/MocA family oxidoreductase [Pirellulaceae bacterium]HJN09235.1 Gfo/Idh/MocA family oxidoreductase [Pirellulaceae bacterium]
MFPHHRREFLKRTIASSVLAPFVVSGTKASGRVLGANDRVRIAVAGINGRGQSHLKGFSQMKDVEIAYLVDPDSRLFDSRSNIVKERAGTTPACVQDIRRALDDKNLDAVSIVTPNHWHALMAIWACRAGKDVYVEKPCSHNIFEGRKLVEAARKYDRIVQHGTQRRSDPQWIQLTGDIRNGKYGKLLVAYAFDRRERRSIGITDPQERPGELDFDLWLGPAPVQPFRTNLVHYNWHWSWDFGNGEIGNLGSHELDVCRWSMPAGAAPKSVVSLGGRFGYKDQGQTPNTQLTMIDFGEVKLLHEARGLVGKHQWKITNEFYTDEGVIRDGKFFAKGETGGVPIENVPPPGAPEQGPRHMQNFMDCVRSRKREDLHAEIIEGHRSTLLAHLGNISYRLGKDVPFDRLTNTFGGDKMFRESFEDMKRHLANAGQLELANSTYRLGRTLSYDAQTEKFVGAPDANQLLSRPYRGPFVVPERV